MADESKTSIPADSPSDQPGPYGQGPTGASMDQTDASGIRQAPGPVDETARRVEEVKHSEVCG